MSNQSKQSTPVTNYLDNKGYAYRYFQHRHQITSLEEAAKERGQVPDQIVRSIVFHLADGEFVMVLVAGLQQLSWSKLRKYLGRSRMTMASKEEIKLVTGYPIGAVSPFGLPSEMRILVDKSVIDGKEDEISFGSGVRNTTIIMKRQDFITALEVIGFETGDFT
jgi:prolyl-tRNA editing enzyme YbaK/EbsC (Cys-tRNA(Pro) deacylase)